MIDIARPSYLRRLADAETHEAQQDAFVRRRLSHSQPVSRDHVTPPPAPLSPEAQAVVLAHAMAGFR